MELRPYQRAVLDDLSMLSSVGLFMGTGTGKTITALFKFKEEGTSNLLVLCPAKVVTQWMAVIPTVVDLKLVEFKKTSTITQKEAILKDIVPHGKGLAVVLSLEAISRLPSLVDMIDDNWTIIVDESHKIKEMGTGRSPVKVTHAVLNLGERTHSKIILTATPTQKDKGGYIDYYSQLRFLGYMHRSLREFKNRYCIMDRIQPIGSPFPIEVIKDYQHTEEIEDILQICCRRYVAKSGDFEPQHIKIELPITESYKKLSRERAYKDLDLTNLTARRIARKTLTGGVVHGHSEWGDQLQYPDNTVKIDWLREFLEDTDEVVTIFYQYNVELSTLEDLCKQLKKRYIVINGKIKDKYAEIHNKEYDVVLGQFAAAGESLDGLQYRCHICVYYAMPESSLAHKQALGRIDRDGQTSVPIYYYLIMEKTLDESIFEMTSRKIEYSEETLNKLIAEVDTQKTK